MYEEEEFERPNFTGNFGAQERNDQEDYQMATDNLAGGGHVS